MKGSGGGNVPVMTDESGQNRTERPGIAAPDRTIAASGVPGR